MKYTNPIVKGFYPDPSVCRAGDKYYLVCSSFQYFPGVPLFESEDLINWKQIGNVLTRKTQVELDHINSSGGVFAPTIRYNNGRFYMVTTNDTTHQNFYVYTDDIYGEWSDPITVDQGGIDPSLLFVDGKTYFISNGMDDFGDGGVVQCEIDIETGKKLSKSKSIWKGSGGRYLESPHMYKLDDGYYLMAAEGGTEYGHMITYARGNDVWGPFEGYTKNPVLTNRNKAPGIIQGIGHGDLIQDKNGDWFILSLGFRQIHIWQAYHHLGREIFLTPVHFNQDGWFTAGNDGTCEQEYEIKGDFTQEEKKVYNFDNTDFNLEWMYLRHPVKSNYILSKNEVILKGTDVTLDMCDTPTFIGIRQRDFDMKLQTTIKNVEGEGGITIYMSEGEHYEIAVRKTADGGSEVILKLNIGNIKHIENTVKLKTDTVKLLVKSNSLTYSFYIEADGEEKYLGYGFTKFLSSEVSGGFTGVMLGMYAVGGINHFRDFEIIYS